MAIERKVSEKAYAKINLGLDVLKRREDGYHEVKMVMQTIGICDNLVFFTSDETKGITLKTDIDGLPCDDSNLIVKAAKMMVEKYDIEQGVEITLEKNIPMAAGMAGGSSDAAATLRGINKLFGLGLTNEELCRIGAKIGADVPFCIYGGTYLAEGIGDKLTSLPDMPQCTVLIAKPNFGVSTKHVYENLHVENIDNHPDMDTVIECVKNSDLGGVAFNLENILENVTVKEYPFIQELKDIMIQRGAMNALMSGSGPTVFGLFDSKANAERTAVEIRNMSDVSEVVVTCFEDMSHEEIRKKAHITLTTVVDDNEAEKVSYDCVAVERRGKIHVTYYEKDPETQKETTNNLTISDRCLIYEKTGNVNTKMVITPDEATTQVYRTEFGDIDLDIICHEYVLDEIADRLLLDVDYDMMQGEEELTHMNIKIEIEYNI